MKVFPITNAPRSIDGFGSGAFGLFDGGNVIDVELHQQVKLDGIA